MIFWLLAITITIIASAALYYAAGGRMVNAGAESGAAAVTRHFQLQLNEIEGDIAVGRLAPAEGIAAKAELARELLRLRQEGRSGSVARPVLSAAVVPVSILGAIAIAFATYAYLGSPNLPSEPLATRADVQTANISVDDAIKQVEARLAAQPDDLNGWNVIAPVYMRSGEYAKAEHAFRQILALSSATADADTNLAEALMMQNGGAASGEAGDLLHRALTLDSHHVRSRFYLAADAMRQKGYVSAVQQWTDLISMGTDSDPWMATAKAGLVAAEDGRDGKPLPGAPAATSAATSAADAANPAQSPAILNMVAGLADRLAKSGGTLADWTRLVRSEIVLGDLKKAQIAYGAARKAYPDSGERAELDRLAAQAGLKIDGSPP
jgi:cytochrome c-type biogenesis protein CcmH